MPQNIHKRKDVTWSKQGEIKINILFLMLLSWVSHIKQVLVFTGVIWWVLQKAPWIVDLVYLKSSIDFK